LFGENICPLFPSVSAKVSRVNASARAMPSATYTVNRDAGENGFGRNDRKQVRAFLALTWTLQARPGFFSILKNDAQLMGRFLYKKKKNPFWQDS